MITLFNLTGFILCFFSISLIVNYVYSELRTDSYHENKDLIYAVSRYDKDLWVPYMLVERMREMPVFNKIIPYGYDWDRSFLKYGTGNALESQTVFVDSTFFNTFSFQFVEGDQRECLSTPFSAVLTQSEAGRIFGNEDPVGKLLKYNAKYDLTITGVIADYPGNSLFPSQCFISFASLKTLTPFSFKCGWDCSNIFSFVMLRSEEDRASAVSELKTILREPDADDPESNPDLYSMHRIYFDKSIEIPDKLNKGNMTTVTVFSFLGLLIFVIALFNYFNLSVASLMEKQKETILLKIFGSSFRQQWMLLFLDAFILAVLAWGVSIFIRFALVPAVHLNQLSFFNHQSVGVAAGIIPFFLILLLALIAGFAGAIFIRRRPLRDLSNPLRNKNGNNFQFLMLMAQFCIVTFLIGATLLIQKQVRFMQDTHPGFSKENLICINSLFKSETSEGVLRKEFLSIPGVQEVVFSDAIPGTRTQGWGTEITVNGEEKEVSFASVPVSCRFLETYGFQLKEGRFFSDTITTDHGNLVINEAAAKEFGWKDPVGRILLSDWTIGNRKLGGKIVGMVEDNYFQSMHKAIEPMVFLNLPGYSNYITIKAAAGLENQKQIINAVKDKWSVLEPDFPFRFFFFDQHLNNEYVKEVEFGKLVLSLSLISIVITMLGLIGMSLFIARGRIKEIGIRKVNGATTGEVIRMLNSRFYAAIAVSILIALPLLWWSVRFWLQTFAYRTGLSWWIFALSASATVVISLSCMTWQSWKAATRNPVEALRYE
jgi:putative ABC transport system permease protein